MKVLDPIARTARIPAVLKLIRSPEVHLRFSERKLILAFGDLFLINAAAMVYILLRFGRGQGDLAGGLQLRWFLLITGLWLVVAQLLNLYDLERAASPLQSAWLTAGAAFMASSLFLLIPVAAPPLPSRRLEGLYFVVLAILGPVAWRVFYALVFVQPAFHQRVLMVGAGWSGSTLAQALVENSAQAGSPRGTGYTVLGFIDDDPAKHGKYIAGVPVLGTRHDLVSLLPSLRPDQIIVAITDTSAIDPDLFETLLVAAEMGIPLSTMDSVYERLTGRVPVEHCGQNFHAFMPLVDHAPTERLYLALRWLLDFVVGVLGCLVLALVIPFVWLANRLASPGPLFYSQERVGRGGRVFRILKFRSMVVDAEKHTGAVWARERDPRVTPIGKFLRKTRLDEIPQFWNVLRGEMSLVGPRPERPFFVECLVREIPLYRLRHAVRPGMTGWAQVQYRYGASASDALVKLEYDLYYIKHLGPYLDLLILLKTVQVVLGLKGR